MSAKKSQTNGEKPGIVTRALSPHFHVSHPDGTPIAKVPVAVSLVASYFNPALIGVHLGVALAAKLAGKETGVKSAHE